MVDGISVWGDKMTTASGCSDAGGPTVDAVGADGCGVIGLAKMWSSGGLSV